MSVRGYPTSIGMVAVATIHHSNGDIGYVACLLDKDEKDIPGTMHVFKHAHNSNVSVSVARFHRLQMVQMIEAKMAALEASKVKQKKVEFLNDVKLITVPRQEPKSVAFSEDVKTFIVPRKEWSSKSERFKEWEESGACLRQQGMCNPITPDDILEESRLERIWGRRRCIIGCCFS